MIGGRMYLSELMGGIVGTAIGVLLEKRHIDQEVRLGGGGTFGTSCWCPSGERAIKCTITELKARITAQALVGYQRDSFRILGQLSGGGEIDFLTGAVSLVGVPSTGCRVPFQKVFTNGILP